MSRAAKKMPMPKLAEIATRIRVHLKRFEADPKINQHTPSRDTRPFYSVNAFASGARLGISYVNYQGEMYLTKQEALDYLAWLDAGNAGKHFELKRRK